MRKTEAGRKETCNKDTIDFLDRMKKYKGSAKNGEKWSRGQEKKKEKKMPQKKGKNNRGDIYQKVCQAGKGGC